MLHFDESSFEIKFSSRPSLLYNMHYKEWNVTHLIHKLDVYGWLVIHFYLSLNMYDTFQIITEASFFTLQKNFSFLTSPSS